MNPPRRHHTLAALFAFSLSTLAQQPATPPTVSPTLPIQSDRTQTPAGVLSSAARTLVGNLPPPPPPISPASRTPDDYPISTEALSRKPGVPAGRVESFSFAESTVFPGTSRDGWVYIPAQYDPAKPAALMVFQDGHAYVSTNGRMRAPIVFDNLIASGEMPVTVGVFINPGHRGDNAPPAMGWGNRSNRSVEYDSPGDAYARFLTGELLPFVTNRYQLNLSPNPRLRAISGMSSGGICAFTAAWEQPDQFGKVLSHIGSFVNIRGGHVYPALIRKTPRKPIRVFLQDGANDLNNLHGDWPLSNQQLAGSLAFAGYEHLFVFGDGAHNDRHGAAILPDSLRWLWLPEMRPPPITALPPETGDRLNELVPRAADAAAWEKVSENHGFTDGVCAIETSKGSALYFADLPKGEVWRMLPGGKPERWIENGPRISGIKAGPDGWLYAASQGGPGDEKQRIIAIHPDTREILTVASNVKPNDLVVTRSGLICFTDTASGQVVVVPTSARNLSGPRPYAGGINAPNGIALSPDHSTLYVSEYQGSRVWAFQLSNPEFNPAAYLPGRSTSRPPAFPSRAALAGPVGSPAIPLLFGAEPIASLIVAPDAKASGGDGSTTDDTGNLFVTSHAGIQIFSPDGRLFGVVPKPDPAKSPVSCTVAPGASPVLYVCDGPTVWRRPLRNLMSR